MSDPRFARLKTDPRFRKPRRKANKIVVDDRFKSIFEDGTQKNRGKGVRVDKYGKKVSAARDADNPRRFYRLADDEETLEDTKTGPDYARGEVLMESSDEDEERAHDSESEDGGREVVVLGRDIRQPIPVPGDDDEELEIDLDESRFAELDAQAAENISKADVDVAPREGERTNRLAAVNLDWDHVRASHLYKIASSILSSPPSLHREGQQASVSVSKGKVLHVRVYPSEFGKKRMAKEEKEGPPKELFRVRDQETDGDDLINEDDGNEYDEEALRKYQLERLRYYYAIITCDAVDAASRIYSELDGTELERSANIFDLSFVPNDMSFDEEFRDEAAEDPSGPYKGVEFVTDALRHSRVKLTWDDDDPERNKITRRALSRKEIEESDFRAYLASSGSEEDEPGIEGSGIDKREKLRALLLGGKDEDNELLPEGWGQKHDKAGEMEITFMPGLSGSKDSGDEDETTLQRYVRKQKEKRKKRKLEKVDKSAKQPQEGSDGVEQDEFFGEDSDNEEPSARSKTDQMNEQTGTSPQRDPPAPTAVEAMPISGSEPKHYDMRAVLKAEKAGSKKRKGKKNNERDQRNLDGYEAQGDFVINVQDERFKAVHYDPSFAIDPSSPHFKKTKSMAAFLEERAKRLSNNKTPTERQTDSSKRVAEGQGQSLTSLVDSVKRKSILRHEPGGKRRKL